MDNPARAQIAEAIRRSIRIKQAILDRPDLLDQIAGAGQLLIDRYQAGNKVLIAGNGGSAADAQHLAAEFVSRFTLNRPALPALALTTDTSILTAISNDYGFDELFARQIEAIGTANDVFLGISTSGNSPNILAALNTARKRGLFTLGLTGETGGKMRDLCQLCIQVPATETAQIQEAHITIGHTWCSLVEQAMFAD